MALNAGLSLKKKKTLTYCYRMPKKCFITMGCDLELYAIIIWHVVNMKLDIDKKIKGLEIMTLIIRKYTIFRNL